MRPVINQLAAEVRAGTRTRIGANMVLSHLADIPFRSAVNLLANERQRQACVEVGIELRQAEEDANEKRWEAENVIYLKTPR